MITHKLVEIHPDDQTNKIVFVGTKEECDKVRNEYALSSLVVFELTDEEFKIVYELNNSSPKFKDNDAKTKYVCSELNEYNHKIFYKERIRELETLLKFEYYDIINKGGEYSYLINYDARFSPCRTYDIFRILFNHHKCATYLFVNVKLGTVKCITTTDNSGDVFKFNSIEEYKTYMSNLTTINLR
jgi:hypothetical protein